MDVVRKVGVIEADDPLWQILQGAVDREDDRVVSLFWTLVSYLELSLGSQSCDF